MRLSRVKGASPAMLCLRAVASAGASTLSGFWLALYGLASPAHAAQVPKAEPALLAHKVTYTLDLARLKAGSLATAGGQATYQIHDLCDAWSVSQKLDVQVTGADGTVSALSYQSATLEDKKGRSFIFRTVQTQDNETTSETAGEARRQRNGNVVVRFTKPEAKVMTLPARVVFPTQFTLQLLDGAHKGVLHLERDLFDGASTDGATPSYATLGRLAQVKPDNPRALFDGLSAVPVSVASFGVGNAAFLPDSTYSDRLWTNGVEDRLLIDFGDYVLSGQIESLTTLPNPRCP